LRSTQNGLSGEGLSLVQSGEIMSLSQKSFAC
jgi:hypothetical protein